MSTLRGMSMTLASGVALSYSESGDRQGLPLLILPGMTDSWHSFGPLAEHLPRSIRVIALSQRCHGDSAKPLGCYGIAELAQDAVAVLDHLGIERAAVLGHCLGSLVAMRMAADAPHRVSGLVLIGVLRTLKNNSSAAGLWREVARMSEPVDPDFVRAFQQSTLARPIAADYLELVIAESLKVPAHVWRSALRSMLDYADVPERITVPACIIWGDQDALASRMEQLAITAALSTVRLIVHQGGGHAPHWEDPRGVAADIAGWARQQALFAA
jgi:non-heme chloroperoxidase